MSTFAENLITDWTRTKREKNACLHKNSVEYFHSLSNSSPRQCQRYSTYPSTLLFKFLKGSNFKDPPQAWPSPCSADAASGVGNRAQGPARYPSRVLDSLDNWLQRFRAMDTLQPAPTGEWRGCAWPHRTAPVTSPSPQCRWLIFYRFQSRPGAARDWPPVAIFPRDIPARVQRSPGHLFTGSRTKRDMKTATTA